MIVYEISEEGIEALSCEVLYRAGSRCLLQARDVCCRLKVVCCRLKAVCRGLKAVCRGLRAVCRPGLDGPPGRAILNDLAPGAIFEAVVPINSGDLLVDEFNQLAAIDPVVVKYYLA